MIATACLAFLLCATNAPATERPPVVDSNTSFAVDLYGKLAAREKGNLFLSPYSISTALAMTWGGARGSTAKQMAATLHFGNDADAVHRGFSLLQKGLASDPKSPFELAVANRLFAQTGKKFAEPFLALTRDRYGAPVEQLDFFKSHEPARQHINLWVEKQTRDRIKDLLAPGVVNEKTRLVLVNAIYFKGSWAKAFEKKATALAPFTLGRSKFDVPMMSGEITAGYAEREGFQVLELPYKSGTGARLSMLVLLPTQADGLAQLESKLSAKLLGELPRGLARQVVQVFLPRFKLESSFSLGDNLQALGMVSAFDCREDTTADFSGMDGERDLCISAVVHKAFVDVNEEGTEAAAATAVIMAQTDSVEPPKPVFRADHPFVFAIVDTASGSVLFLGRVVDPR